MKRALILSGGGALGAFQAGALMYLKEKKAYEWDLIAGVSIGALNGAMVSMNKYQRLYDVWLNEMSPEFVFGFFGLKVPTGLLRRRSLYSGKQIRKVVEQELGDKKFEVPLLVGTLDLVTGGYRVYDDKDPHILDAVIASAAMPIISPPVRVGADPWMIDGGIRNTSPVGEVLEQNPDEIVIIACFSRKPGPATKPPSNLFRIGTRSYEVMAHEIFVEDLKELRLINDLVQQAKPHGVRLRHPNPERDRDLRYVPAKIIEPAEPLGDGLDFSSPVVRKRFDLGFEAAQRTIP